MLASRFALILKTLLIGVFTLSSVCVFSQSISIEEMARITRGDSPFQVSSRFSPLSEKVNPLLDVEIDTLAYRIPAMVTRWADSLHSFSIHRTRSAGHIVTWDFSRSEIEDIRNKLEPYRKGDSILYIFHKPGMYTQNGPAVDFYITNDTTLISVQRIEWNAYPCLIRWKDGMTAGCVGWYELLNIAEGNSAYNLDTTWTNIEPAEDIVRFRVPLGQSEFIVKGEPEVWRQRENGPYIQRVATDDGNYVRYVTYLECAKYLEDLISECSSEEVPVVHLALPYDQESRDADKFEYFYSTIGLPVYTLNGYHMAIFHDHSNQTSTIIVGPAESWEQNMKENEPSHVYIYPSLNSIIERQFTQSLEDYPVFSDMDYINTHTSGEARPSLPECTETSEHEKFICFQQKINSTIAKHFEFPEISRQIGSQGRAWVDFVIATNGAIVGINVVRSSGDIEIDKAAMRAVGHLPQMIPAILDGKPVRMRYSVPLNARLQ
ncbi:energy transducer TonB [Phaeocystidibacter marisrubri]|uniref:Energy transducer TonB n=1 Tax=Phaeocystidibacter marisrubri TaxID=1577780 RepID=A0A6L3ZEH9_9FLAO|nr:energy transducer TonB [Phaeocystidibacter marisrubri]KAB2815854.1 energy transducer TonB [Phaeocystidibacter marisrubri]GGH66064.1 hypothetical protein GCM10011318_03650 [Phaeocystidibacter marisrubri]